MSAYDRNEEIRILLVDDEPAVTDSIRMYFEQHLLCEVLSVSNSVDAAELLQTEPFDLVVTDVYHPGWNGLDLTRFAKEYIGTKVIILTGYRGTRPADAKAAGADAFFYKPVLLKTLLLAVRKIIDEADDEHGKCKK